MASRTTISKASFLAATMVVSVQLHAPAASAAAASQVVSLGDYRAFKRLESWHIIKAKVEAWGELQPDWDSEGGVPPSAAATRSACDFLQQIQSSCTTAPQATIAGDGEISFEWSKGEGYASASFTDDGHFIGYLKEGSGADALRLDSPVSDEVVQPFLERIGAFA